MQNSISHRSAVMVLAHNLRKKHGYTWGEAQRKAWKTFDSEKHQVIKFFAIKYKKFIKRVVAKKLTDYYTPTGTSKRKAKPGLKVYADVAKIAAGKDYFVISAYHAESLSVAA